MPPRALICDFDNTLYDWIGYFVPSFFAMVDAAVGIIGCDREQLLLDFKLVHQKHGDSEHPFSLLETSTVVRAFSGRSPQEIRRLLDPAFHAFNRARKEYLFAYEGVHDALERLSSIGIRIVGHTEARPLAVRDRLKRLSLERFFSRVYCRERAEAHAQVDFDDANSSELVELSHHQQKPSASVLFEICDRENLNLAEAVYVGDSLFKDVSMANAANMPVAWAKYGTHAPPEVYAKLVSVSHWSDADVARARQFSRGEKRAVPTLTLERSLVEILPMFEARSSTAHAYV